MKTERVRPGPVRVIADIQFIANAWAFAWRTLVWVLFGLLLVAAARGVPHVLAADVDDRCSACQIQATPTPRPTPIVIGIPPATPTPEPPAPVIPDTDTAP